MEPQHHHLHVVHTAAGQWAPWNTQAASGMTVEYMGERRVQLIHLEPRTGQQPYKMATAEWLDDKDGASTDPLVASLEQDLFAVRVCVPSCPFYNSTTGTGRGAPLEQGAWAAWGRTACSCAAACATTAIRAGHAARGGAASCRQPSSASGCYVAAGWWGRGTITGAAGTAG